MHAVLHFHNNIFPGSGQTIKVIDNTRIVHIVRTVFFIQKNQVFNLMLSSQQFIQQSNQSILTCRLPEDNFKTNICKRIHEMTTDKIRTPHIPSFLLKTLHSTNVFIFCIKSNTNPPFIALLFLSYHRASFFAYSRLIYTNACTRTEQV